MAEVLTELLYAELDGSIRLSTHDSKAVIYVRDGELLFAVSNQRRFRMFQMLLDANLITKAALVDIPEFTNDVLLAKTLRQRDLVPETALEMLLARQVESILYETIGWKEGTWNFSPLARIKSDMRCNIDVQAILVKYARDLPPDSIVRRFRSFKESFGRKASFPAHINLVPREAFLLSRFENGLLRIEELNQMTGLPDAENLRGLYSLWLGGFLMRTGWNAPISARQITEIHSAKLELKMPDEPVPEPVANEPSQPVEAVPKPESPVDSPGPVPEPKQEISLESYLLRIESSETHYETLDVPIESSAEQIKNAYFALAKRFHPDLHYRSADDESRRRIQNAFTEIAHAYETLRNEDTRLGYDYRLKAILDELRRQGKNPEKKEPTSHKQLTEASEIFDHGFNLLMEEEYEAALPYLTRAVSMAPNNARYHAYYGKVLSADRSLKFKAEAEIQTAIKLEPENPTFRLLLAEFFIDHNLLKRAEGELNRLIANFPDNSEARAMLDRLR
ncbi:MAG: DnaJ domain-containing protein [Acidobacteria bacterium]|nr:DnaJ domain-containing protein [Acidobacteriota bacterium]